MATTVVSTIMSAGGDYTSIAAWEADKQGDLVAADQVQKAVCHDLQDAGVQIDGSTTDATRFLWIAGASAIGPTWSTSKYRIQQSSWGGLGVVRFVDPFCLIEDIQIEMAGSQAVAQWACIDYAAPSCSVNRAIVRQGTYSGTRDSYGIHISPAAAGVCTARNIVAIGFRAGAGDGFRTGNPGAHGNAVFQNVLAYDCDQGFADQGVGFTSIYQNCAAQGCTDGFAVNAHASCANNASDTADAPGSAGQSGSATFVDAGGGDFTPAAGDAILKANGADLSGSFTTDLMGATRSTPWDIGPLRASANSRRISVSGIIL